MAEGVEIVMHHRIHWHGSGKSIDAWNLGRPCGFFNAAVERTTVCGNLTGFEIPIRIEGFCKATVHSKSGKEREKAGADGRVIGGRIGGGVHKSRCATPNCYWSGVSRVYHCDCLMDGVVEKGLCVNGCWIAGRPYTTGNA
ncbi:hypothetical protein T02_2642 [Trichinella nativa]|uniref:Uncharacterized protein n=1 Tax=Trichinella nativa TaxID=6335 RepID=A0A0V1LKY6_9BILA|nr:hypothetical protein T02_2642 [Trichinella nativa]